MHGHVKGGTNAGWRNPFQGAAMPWQCDCTVSTRDCPTCDLGDDDQECACFDRIAKTNPGYLTNCLDCGQRRPTPQAPS